MAVVAIIDWRRERRELIEDWLRQQGHEVLAAENRALLSLHGVSPNLLLLHVGATQVEQQGDDIYSILVEFGHNTWIVGYSGGARAPAAHQSTAPSVAGLRGASAPRCRSRQRLRRASAAP